jgi:glycosyltransferase involved in cell wall biosynthesis
MMKKAIRKLFELENIDSRDRLVLPNGDLLCSNSIIRIVKKLGKNNSPKIAIRFINVMENVGIPKLLSKKSTLKSLRALERKNFHIKITSETDNYRRFLAKYFSHTALCEYPTVPKSKNLKISQKTVIGVLGSARPDKGFNELERIIPILNSSNFGNDINFIVQSSTESWGKNYEHTLSLLRDFPSTKILPGYISDQEMQEIISSCTALLLPYDTNVYEFRGSAMLFDAADLNIPIIAPAGTGMGTTIRRFGIGATYSLIAEIPSAVNFVSLLSQEEIDKRFSIYNDFRSSTLRKFFE